MIELKHALDAKGHGAWKCPPELEDYPLLSLITSYQLQYPHACGNIYCTRTVPEMEKVLAELKGLQKYREENVEKEGERHAHFSVRIVVEENLCVNPKVAEEGSRESVDASQKLNRQLGARRKKANNKKQQKHCRNIKIGIANCVSFTKI